MPLAALRCLIVSRARRGSLWRYLAKDVSLSLNSFARRSKRTSDLAKRAGNCDGTLSALVLYALAETVLIISGVK